MILDRIENAALYASVAPGLEELLKAELDYANEAGASGGRRVHGDRMFINDNIYDTKPMDKGALHEAHRKYIDAFYMVEGEEMVYVKPTSCIKKITRPYDPEGDALLGTVDGDETAIRLQPGQFLILFPQDAHCPSRNVGEGMRVRKLVGKLAVDFEG